MKKNFSLTAVIEKEGKWYVATCPELGVASQGHTVKEAHVMIQEAVNLFLETASPQEIKEPGRKQRGIGVAVDLRATGSLIIADIIRGPNTTAPRARRSRATQQRAAGN
jgi:predicted RNase H-like HicB family nuclease